jgi:hypothetical protein
VLFDVVGTSLMESRYKTGPSTLPCGTTAFISFSFEYEFSCLTRKCRLVKYDFSSR